MRRFWKGGREGFWKRVKGGRDCTVGERHTKRRGGTGGKVRGGDKSEDRKHGEVGVKRERGSRKTRPGREDEMGGRGRDCKGGIREMKTIDPKGKAWRGG